MKREEAAQRQMEFQRNIDSCLDALMSFLRYEMQYGIKENRFACEVTLKHLMGTKKAFRQAINYGHVNKRVDPDNKERK